MTMINTAIFSDFSEDHAVYSERVEIPDLDLKIEVHYELYSQDNGNTRLNFNVNWMGATLPAENKQGMMDAQAANLELLKDVCEKNPT